MTEEERDQLIKAVQAALEPMLDERIGGLNQRIDGLDQRMDGLERQVGDLDRRVSSISDDILQPFISIAGKRHQELVERVDRVEQIATAALAGVQRLEGGPIRQLLSDVADVQLRLTRVEQLLVERGALIAEEVVGTGERWVTWSEYRDLEIRVRALEEQIASYNAQPGEKQ